MATLLADYTVPTTLLQAVNVVMGALGKDNIASLAVEDLNGDANFALQNLGLMLRSVLMEGWDFNVEIDQTFTPDSNGEVLLPVNCLHVVEVYYPGGTSKNLVERDRKLYDTMNQTFNVGANLTSTEGIKVRLTMGLDFDQIPEAARWYVTVKAARRAASLRTVSTGINKFTTTDENEARDRFEQMMNDSESQTTMANAPGFWRTRRRF